MSTLRVTMTDKSNETSTVKLNVADAITDADITVLYAALANVTIGTRGTAFLDQSVAKDQGSSAIPAADFAARETKWLCSYTDDVTGRGYRKEIPTADLAIRVSGTELADLSTGGGLAWKNAWDAHVLSPNGNATTLQAMKHVGRNI